MIKDVISVTLRETFDKIKTRGTIECVGECIKKG